MECLLIEFAPPTMIVEEGMDLKYFITMLHDNLKYLLHKEAVKMILCVR
jgi:hypothetical protein